MPDPATTQVPVPDGGHAPALVAPAPADVDVSALEAGLDQLDSAVDQQRPPLWRRLLGGVLPPALATLGFVVIWQLVYLLGIKPAYVLPGPADAWAAISEQWRNGAVTEAVWNSLRRAAIGFGLSVVLGTILGLVLARVRPVRQALGPLISGLQALPSVAWVPAAIIWFGLTDAAIYTVVLLGAVPSIANGLLAGIDQTPPLYLQVGRVLGARNLSAIRFVLLPAALPAYFAGLRQGWAFAWRSLMAAELIAYSPALGTSLGQMLQVGRELSDMSLVIASIGLILAVGIGVELLLFAPIERRMLRSRGLLGSTR